MRKKMTIALDESAGNVQSVVLLLNNQFGRPHENTVADGVRYLVWKSVGKETAIQAIGACWRQPIVKSVALD